MLGQAGLRSWGCLLVGWGWLFALFGLIGGWFVVLWFMVGTVV